ncbi:MAG TPA: DASS family sodium-coupled anion symporter, partial [Longimicrobium sp.]|nr:DASS family sodium-coupled anion symporter [Longimicrobium sp.]
GRPARAPGAEAVEEPFRWPADRPGDVAAPAALPRGPGRAGRLRDGASIVGLLLAVAVYLAPAADGLPREAQAAAAVFVACTTLWITDLIPIGVTGLLAVALLALGGAMEPAEAYAAFGNSAVFFIIGVFILAAATIHSGLSKRLTLFFLRRFERSSFSLAAGLMMTAAFMTMWMPAQATAAMLFPIALELSAAMGLRPRESTYGKALFLSLAWGAMVGSNASFLGRTRAPLALGLLQRGYGETITFVDWFIASLPVVAAGLVVGLLVLRVAFRPEPVDLAAARRSIHQSVAELGSIGRQQLIVSVVVGATVLAWVTLSTRLDLAAVALAAAGALFLLRVLRWKDLDGYVHWGIVLMYGGAIALGEALESTGAATWLVGGLMEGVRVSPWTAVAGLALLTVVLTALMSNAAAVAVTLPLGFSLAGTLGLSPVTIVLTCSLAAGLDFTFPFSSAPNTIAYSSGYLGMGDVVRAGAVMTVLQIVLLLVVAWLYWPLIGVL